MDSQKQVITQAQITEARSRFKGAVKRLPSSGPLHPGLAAKPMSPFGSCHRRAEETTVPDFLGGIKVVS